jgi:hypothetical protein
MVDEIRRVAGRLPFQVAETALARLAIAANELCYMRRFGMRLARIIGKDL